MELQLSDLLNVTGVAALCVLLVQILKRYLPEDKIPLLAVGLGITVAVLARCVLGPVSPETVAQAVLTGFLGGIGSIGVYEITPRAVLPAKSD